MKINNMGNNIIKSNLNLKKDLKLSQNKYFYYYIILKKNCLKNISLNEFTIFFLNKSKHSKIYINGNKINIKKGDCINFFNAKNSTVKSSGPSTTILVAGVKKKITKKSSFIIEKEKEIYKVKKPWGYEKWLNRRGKYYAFKKIFLKSGNKTSLQYHNYKIETNFLIKGKAEFIYKKNKNVKNLNVRNGDLESKIINSQSIIFVKRKTLHRIKAITNLILFETSTPQLDDVIRVSDDKNRASGLISAEHK